MLSKVILKILLSSFILLSFTISLYGNDKNYYKKYKKISKLFYEWNPIDAKPILDSIENELGTDINFLFLKSRYHYLMGEYKKAYEIIDYIKINFPKKNYQGVSSRMEIIENSYKNISKYKKYSSNNGKFVVYLPEGKDEVMANYALKVLESSYKTHSKDLDFTPKDIVRLEILPSVEVLDQLSGLTLKEIQTSGTIALADDNKILITSPKSLVKGYHWTDTICHELAHWFITKKTKNRTPIWIHEAFAKFQENRWRSKPGLELDKYSEHILATAHKKKHYITFEQMSPSFAKLPSQEDSSLAYAQVATLADWAYKKYGYSVFNKLLHGLKKYNNDSKAVKHAFGVSKAGLLNIWKKHLTKTGYKTYPGLLFKPILFKTSTGDEYKLAEVELFKNRKMKRFMRLGNLLSEINRKKAAKMEYEKALRYKKNEFPYLENRLATLYLNEKNYKKAVDILKPTLNMFPQYIDTHMNLGEAYLNLKNYKQSKFHLNKAIELNPFLPQIYQSLEKIYKKLGDKDGEKEAKNNFLRL